jgi:hypothetical protein
MEALPLTFSETCTPEYPPASGMNAGPFIYEALGLVVDDGLVSINLIDLLAIQESQGILIGVCANSGIPAKYGRA